MTFPKPDYIQNFIDDKLRKDKRQMDRAALIYDDELSPTNGYQGNQHGAMMDTPDKNSLTVKRNNGHNSASPSSFSESDDAVSRSRGYHSGAEIERVRRGGRNKSSDADYETDESQELSRRRAASSPGGSRRKTKTDRTPLFADKGESNSAYGGTETVELNYADSNASYSPKLHQAGASQSTDKLKLTKQNGARKNKKRHGEDHGHGRDHGKHNHEHAHGDHDSDEHSSGSSYLSGVESEHCHDSSDERTEKEQRNRDKAMKKLMIATALSFLFMVGEVVGGYLANSLAIMTDASHLLTDVSSFLISIIALKMAARPISKKMTFGWHRAEVIGALISVMAIWVVTGVLVYLAVMRLIHKDYEVNGKTMLITASMAVGFNIVMGLVLHEHHGHAHGHSHGSHNHDHDHETGNNSHKHDGPSGNVNVRAAFIHVVGDLLQSLGVLVAAFIIYFKPEYKIADPICTFLFSIFVLITTITILRDTVIIIMEGSPIGIEYNDVKEKLLEIDGVTAVHDLRIWSLTLNQTVMSAHLAIDKSTETHDILKRATRKLKALYDFHSLTLQIEYYSNDMDECKKCQPA